MREIFADTVFWLAIFLPDDPWSESVREIDWPGVTLVTTEEVLTEFLAAVSSRGEHIRTLACQLVRRVMADSEIQVVSQSHDSFVAGLALYERRPDKKYSLTDCISMNVMRQRKIEGVLTSDRHFSQEGFIALLRRSPAK